MALGITSLAVTPAFAAKKSSAQSASKAIKAYTSCLAKHGVKLPKRTGHRRPSGSGGFPAFGGGGTNSSGSATGAPPSGGFPGGGFFRSGTGGSNSKYAKAAAACKSKLPKGGFGGFGGNGGNFKPTATQQAALTKFEQCMSAHGVQIASNASFATITSLLSADPSAASACRSDLSGAFGRRGGAPTGSPPSSTTS